MTKKFDSKWLSLVTAPILGQPSEPPVTISALLGHSETGYFSCSQQSFELSG
jgi:hypothetical protein